jgi:hypothetical protein
MDAIYLTAGEQKLFDALPKTLSKGWQVEEEDQVYEDTKEKFMVRISLMNLRDPKLLALQERVKKTRSHEEIIPLVDQLSLADISESDLLELFFAMGPKILSVNIADLLKRASGPADMNAIAALTFIRRSILTSLLSASTQWSARNK